MCTKELNDLVLGELKVLFKDEPNDLFIGEL